MKMDEDDRMDRTMDEKLKRWTKWICWKMKNEKWKNKKMEYYQKDAKMNMLKRYKIGIDGIDEK